MPQISIIIPVHNNWMITKECIKAVLANTNNYEIIFVIDEKVQFREKLKSYGQVIGGPMPFIFAQRINLAMKEARSQYVCILNNDTKPAAGWLEKLIKTDKRLGPGLVSARCQKDGCSNLDTHGEGQEQYTKFTINMWCLLAERRTFDVIGPLDERFIYYGGEDDDYSLRALRHGFKLIVSDAFVEHKVGGAFDSEKVKNLLPKTRELFLNKWEIDLPRPPEHWADEKRIGYTRPLITIIMSTRDHEKYIREAVESVFAQSYQNIQLIVGVDGQDQPETLAILKEIYDKKFKKRTFRFVIIKTHEQVGCCDMRNRAFEFAAYGEFIAIMDSDDIMLTDRLKDELALMTSETDIIHSAFILKNEHGVKEEKNPGPVNLQQLMSLNTPIAGGTFLMRRYCMEKEPFSEKWARASDFEYYLRTRNKFKYKYLTKPTIIYRRHSGPHLSGNNEAYEDHKALVLLHKGDK